jgi:hypothetical protein
MILTIHQPEFLPWLGFFHKMNLADQYVVLDSVQYEKNYFQNRNKIRTSSADGWNWITIPVLKKDRSTQLIQDVEIDQNVIARQQKKNWKSIEQSYQKAPYFEMYEGAFKEVLLNQEQKKIVDTNLRLISTFRDILAIQTPLTLASALETNLNGSDLLLEICEKLGADTYLSGPHGRDYLDESEFEKRGIKVKYHEFQHPEYPQIHGDHMPYMSTLDLIFNHGPDSMKILTGDG